MKKVLSLLLCLLMIFNIASCTQDPAQKDAPSPGPEEPVTEPKEPEMPETPEEPAPVVSMTPGTYTAVSLGFGGEMTVDVTVTETEIKDIVVGENMETKQIFGELTD